MGCVQSGYVDNDAEAKARNDAIETRLGQDARMMRSEVKILFLEAGDEGSGKTVLMPQMKFLLQGGYNDEERESYRGIIFSNITEYMRAILEEIPELGLSITPEYDACCAVIMALPKNITEIPHEAILAIQSLWRNPEIREATKHSQKLALHNSAVYYINAIDRMAAPGYLPSDQDILRSATTRAGIRETTTKVGELTYRFLDPGQQSHNRKKWIHCFERVTALAFLADLSDYSREDEGMNTLQTTLNLFDSICNSRWLLRTSIILILKVDTFAETLLRLPLGDYFPDYQGNNYDNACDYLLHRFVSLNQNTAERQIFAHYMLADASGTKFVLSAIQDILLQAQFRSRGKL